MDDAKSLDNNGMIQFAKATGVATKELEGFIQSEEYSKKTFSNFQTYITQQNKGINKLP